MTAYGRLQARQHMFTANCAGVLPAGVTANCMKSQGSGATGLGRRGEGVWEGRIHLAVCGRRMMARRRSLIWPEFAPTSRR